MNNSSHVSLAMTVKKRRREGKGETRENITWGSAEEKERVRTYVRKYEQRQRRNGGNFLWY